MLIVQSATMVAPADKNALEFILNDYRAKTVGV